MLYLLTATSGRSAAFEYCKRWVARMDDQDYKWLIVSDDYDDYKFPKGSRYKVIKKEPDAALHSLNANLLAGLEYLEKQKDFTGVVFVEDDDWYSTNYLATVRGLLHKAEVVGFNEDCYYYALTRNAYRCHNQDHASLAATAITKAAIPAFKEVVLRGDPMIDVPFWQSYKGKKKLWHDLWFTEYGTRAFMSPQLDKEGNAICKGPFHVGIKQNWHQGKDGISEFGHDLQGKGGVDFTGRKLEEWLGSEAKAYLRFTHTPGANRSVEPPAFQFLEIVDREGVIR